MAKRTAKKARVVARKTKIDLFASKRKHVESATVLLRRDNPALLETTISEICVRYLGGNAPPELLAFFFNQKLVDREFILDSVRSHVDNDQTIPIAAKFVGRALFELGALNEESASNRIDIFAFFASGTQAAILVQPDHQNVAKACHKAVEANRKGKPLPAVTTLDRRNKASKALGKPLERLQDLGLVEVVGVFRGKDSASRANFLINCGALVFADWPDWPV